MSSPIINLPFRYVEGLIISNDATTPDEIINISAGRVRDSLDNIDMTVGVDNDNVIGNTVTAPLDINNTINGAGGLDAGTIAAATVYAVYIIGDSHYFKPTAGLLSLASNSEPTLPFEYDSFRLIGFVTTDATSDFILGFMTGTGVTRKWHYISGILVVNNGAATSFADVSLVTVAPTQENAIILFQTNFTANAAADTLDLTKFGVPAALHQDIAPVAGATAVTLTVGTVLSGLDSGVPTIAYRLSAGTVDIFVRGYEFSL